MARKKSSTVDDFVEIVASLPWWVGVGLALFFYVLLHALARPHIAAPTNTGQISAFATRTLFASLAAIGQYFVPFLCLLGSLVSFMRRRQREDLVQRTASARGADALNGMSWQEFELLVGEAFRLQGYQVVERGGPAPDGGVDIELRKGNELFLVQCKQWKAYQVSVLTVREFYGVMAKRGAAGGFVVTSGAFTEDARTFVEGTNVRLVDGPKLFGLLQQAKARGRIAPQTAATPQTKPAAPAQSVPDCPVCKSPMKLRTAAKGPNAGSMFWGCSQFPSCRGTRAI